MKFKDMPVAAGHFKSPEELKQFSRGFWFIPPIGDLLWYLLWLCLDFYAMKRTTKKVVLRFW